MFDNFKENFKDTMAEMAETENENSEQENYDGFSGADIAVAGLVTVAIIGTGVLVVKGVKKIMSKKDSDTTENKPEPGEAKGDTKPETQPEPKKQPLMVRFAKNTLDKNGLMVIKRSEYEDIKASINTLEQMVKEFKDSRKAD